MKRNRIYTKFIVVIGYCLMMLLAISGFVTIYLEMSKLSNTVDVPGSKQELLGLNNTLSTLFQAESTASLMSAGKVPEYIVEFDSLTVNAFTQIDLLKLTTNNPDIITDLDTLASLLNRKLEIFHELIRLTEKIDKNTNETVITTQTEIVNRPNIDELYSVLVNKTEETRDTVVTIPPKKGFFKRLKNVIKPGDQDSTVQVSTQTTTSIERVAVPVDVDTIVKSIKETNKVLLKKNYALIRQLIKRKNELHWINEQTHTQIEQITNHLEIVEYENDLISLNETNKLLKKSTTLVTIIAIVAIIFSILLMSWTLISVNQEIKLQKSLRKSQKDTKKALASREQLIYTITHDIKAPISSIMGFLDLISKNDISPKYQYYLDNMNASAVHILDLVKNMLDFQTLEKNQQKINNLPFTPGFLISNIYDSFLPAAQNKRLVFELNSTIPETDKYTGDPYRIRQILNNLISNAIKFTPEKGQIFVSATINDNNMQVSIKDTGVGIDEKDIELIFEAFTRLKETQDTTEGVGLGLNITKQLAQMLGGNIKVESIKGEGSDFIVNIPLCCYEEKEETFIPEKPDINIVLPEIPIRILFIDDDIIQLNLLAEVMKKVNLPCAFCKSSSDALKLIDDEKFDIIFTDINMPGMKGSELVEHIRNSSYPGAKTVPIIGFSADSQWMDNEKECPFSGFLQKPFNTEDLLKTIEKYTCIIIPMKPDISELTDFSIENFMQFFSNDKELALNMINSFIEETNNNLNLLEKAFDEDDKENIMQISHKMSSLMKMISALEIVSILIFFEKGEQSKEKQVTLFALIKEKIEEIEVIRKILKEDDVMLNAV
jgi:signal transduction histidine kinase/CheY-like chemotaxis protein